MKVWESPARFVASGAIVIFAFTYRFVAGPLPPASAFAGVPVTRVTSAVLGGFAPSAKCQTAVAFAVKIPVLVLLIVRVQVAVLPFTCGALQVDDCDVGAGLTLGVIEVNVAVVPAAGNAFVVIVNVCGSPTLFTSSGVIETFAFT